MTTEKKPRQESLLADCISEVDVLKDLHVTARTLRTYRHRRGFPKAIPIGRDNYFNRALVLAWIAALGQPKPRRRRGAR